MCMIDGGDRAEVWNQTIVRARKLHKCDECDRAIVVGERYAYVFLVYEGQAFQHHTCEHCRVAQEWLLKNCGGFLHQGVYEDIEEHTFEYPALKRPLCRLLIGMRRQWRRFDKSGLFTVPAAPVSIKELIALSVPPSPQNERTPHA